MREPWKPMRKSANSRGANEAESATRRAMRTHAEQTDPRNLLSRARADNVDIEIDHDHGKDRKTYEYILVIILIEKLRLEAELIRLQKLLSSLQIIISPQKGETADYTGHIPGVRGEVALSKKYAQAARKSRGTCPEGRREEQLRVNDTNAVESL
ncbi:PREDICTED: uncharacterized protein LOC105459629 [Wasmannia auropunctata]|uniref:uncharacterized protein LOC105459629 n=1 Tax=Wasmannia auropunctata TaxID=64793 RepID=UPI0005EF1F65|nr:PREDICTED: uncharacterized protein LOC105459629 [Wasmannia auropunctata]